MDGYRIVTLEGGRDAFCTGLDPHDAANPAPGAKPARELVTLFAKLLEAIERAPFPVIALVDGAAAGGGVGLAAAADLVVATPRAAFSLPETLLGLVPIAIFPALARRIGVPRARWLALGAAALSAEEAHRLGLVDEIAGDLEAATERYSRRLERMDRRAVAELKQLVWERYGTPEAHATEAAARIAGLLDSPETRNRLMRFARGEAPWEDGPDRGARSGTGFHSSQEDVDA